MKELTIISQPAACPNGCRTRYTKHGCFLRIDDQKLIQRYRCSACGKTFSDATIDPCYRQHKRSINQNVFTSTTGLQSLRRIALDLKINIKTAARKTVWLGGLAKALLNEIAKSRPPANDIAFDDLETSIHTKCKPVTICLAVDNNDRWILDWRVASMPATGRLAKISRKKYGPRADDRRKLRNELFEELNDRVHPQARIVADKNPAYPPLVRRHFPEAIFQTFKGRRARDAGQGELKVGGYDPLWKINHTFAMLRANINRLIRKTWCTSKRQDRLDLHVALYVLRHNLTLI